MSLGVENRREVNIPWGHHRCLQTDEKLQETRWLGKRCFLLPLQLLLWGFPLNEVLGTRDTGGGGGQAGESA